MDIALSSFYREKAPNINDFNKFFQIYDDFGKTCLELVKQIEMDGLLGNIGTFKTIPIQNIDASPLRYSLSELLSRKTIYDLLNLADIPLLGRIIMWISGQITVAQKVSVLGKSGYYIDLLALNDYTALWNQNDTNDIAQSVRGKVVWFDLYDGPNKMVYGLDYVIADQRLFLTGTYVTTNSDNSPVLQMKNIAVDFNWAEKRFGSIFNIKYKPTITLNEYSTILQSLARINLGGPRIKYLREAIVAIAGTSDVTIYDRYTRDTDNHIFWDLSLQDGFENQIIGPFDFIVEINNETGLDAYRMYALTQYLQVASPAGSKLNLLLNLSYSDIYAGSIKLSDSYSSNVLNGLSNDEQIISIYSTQSLLNNPDANLNEDFVLYRGFIRTDEHDDELIPV